MTSQQLTRSASFRAAILICLAIVGFRFVYPPVNILSWDVFGYYLYLPAQFIYHDLKLHDLSWVNMLVEKYKTTETLYQLYPVQDNGWVIKESIGLAVLNAPAFFLSHIISQALGYPADGFSLPYQYGFAISGLLYAVLGVFMLRKILLNYFEERTTVLMLILIVGGTNHFQLTAFDGYLTHNYLFTLYTFIVWFSLKWHRERKAKQAFWLGLSMGLAVLTRPSEMVCVVIPLFWGIYNRESLVQKWSLIREHRLHLLLLILAMFLGGLPQLIYWKNVTGNWIYYTYQNPGEGLDLWAPYTLKFLFSFRKGWLIYTPLMAVALAGFYWLAKRQKELLLPFTVYFLLNLWIISSWTAWWYGGGSYSQRAMLPSYVLMALPLGFVVDSLLRNKSLLKWAGLGILGLLLILNMFQTWQWAHGIIDRTRMTKAYYFATFGRTRVDPEDRKLLLIDKMAPEIIPQDKTGLQYKRLYFNDFETGSQQAVELSDTAFSGRHAQRVSPAFPFAGGYEIPYDSLTRSDYAWIRVSVRVFPLKPLSEVPASLVASFEHKGGVYKYKAESLDKKEYDVRPNQWNLVSFDYLTPDIRSGKDKLKVYFWLQGNSPIIIDDLTVEMWEPGE